jgi:hypothetical protein
MTLFSCSVAGFRALLNVYLSCCCAVVLPAAGCAAVGGGGLR